MIKTFVGLGSNLGEREIQIRRAVEELAKLPRTTMANVSSLYDTDPVGDLEQPPYLNAVAWLQTDLTPREVLWNLLLIEQRLGRVRAQKWGPRTIDLDLLFYGSSVVEEADLVVPHPEAHRRGFVLAPLAELDPEFVHPITNLTVAKMLRRLKADRAVRKGGRIWT